MPLRLWLTVSALALAAPAWAANLALVLDTGGEGDAGSVADALDAQGYEIYTASAPTRQGLRQAISDFAGRIDEAERAVLVAAGPTLAEDGAVWLLPEGFDGESWLDAAFEGVALDTLLRIAGERPGRAAVILAQEPRDGGAAVEAGAVDVPQGVLLVTGSRTPALAVVAGRLLAGASVAEGLAGAEDVSVAGFLSPDVSFAPAGPTAAAPPPPAPSPEERAAADEAQLALDQAGRRQIQEDLTVLGFSTRGIDGIFGPGTRSAIAEWQEQEDFKPTGYLAAAQLARLRERAEARTAELAAEAERIRAEEEAADAAFWRSTGAGGSAADLRAYLGRYPDGVYAAEARAALDRLEADARAEAEAGDRDAWAAAEGADDVAAYRAYLEERPDGAFAGEAAARIEALEEAPQQEVERQQAAERESGLGLNRGSRALIESQLAAVGYDVGAQDGEFDGDFRQALRQFQSRQGLPATGYVDQATVQALIVASLGLR